MNDEGVGKSLQEIPFVQDVIDMPQPKNIRLSQHFKSPDRPLLDMRHKSYAAKRACTQSYSLTEVVKFKRLGLFS